MKNHIYSILDPIWAIAFIATLAITSFSYLITLIKEALKGNIMGAVLGVIIGFALNEISVCIFFGLIRIILNWMKPKRHS